MAHTMAEVAYMPYGEGRLCPGGARARSLMTSVTAVGCRISAALCRLDLGRM
jgi:hypothetical protein